MIEQDENTKKNDASSFKYSIVLKREKLKVPACVMLSPVYELEGTLIYECKSTHGLTDKQIEKIKMNAKRRHDDELEKSNEREI